MENEYSCTKVKTGGSGVDLCIWNQSTQKCEVGNAANFDKQKCESYNKMYAEWNGTHCKECTGTYDLFNMTPGLTISLASLILVS